MNSPQTTPRVKSQDFTLNQILCGESSKILAEFPADCVDLIITDPPYLCNYRDRSGRTVANDNDADGVLPVIEQMYRVLKPDSYCISFYGWNAIAEFSEAWKQAGFKVVGQIIWAKDYSSKSNYLNYRHESAFVLAKGNPAKPNNPIDDIQP